MGDIQKRILDLISARGWSIYKLAREAGIHQTTIYDWFNDKSFTPSRKSIEAVCAALNISVAEFYNGIGEGKLDDEQMRLLELFAKVPESKRKIVFDLLTTLAEDKK